VFGEQILTKLFITRWVIVRKRPGRITRLSLLLRNDGAVTPGDLRTPPAVSLRISRTTGWLLAVAGLGGLLFTAGLVFNLECAVGHCPAPLVRRLFDLDGLGSLPRLFTTAVLLGVGVLAALASWRAVDRARAWWGLVAAGGVLLACAKAVSAHSSMEQDDGRVVTLVVGVLVTVVGLPLLWWAGRRWSVPAVTAVTAALAAYALAALGLDQVTAAVVTVSRSPVLRVFALYLEEGGEAVTGLVVLATVALTGRPRR
jgi:hypothetical protein